MTKSRFYKRPSMKQQFVWFLMRKGALVKFVSNRKLKAKSESIEYIFNKGNLAFYTQWIHAAFRWENTPEGWDYWHMLECQWIYESRRIFTS